MPNRVEDDECVLTFNSVANEWTCFALFLIILMRNKTDLFANTVDFQRHLWQPWMFDFLWPIDWAKPCTRQVHTAFIFTLMIIAECALGNSSSWMHWNRTSRREQLLQYGWCTSWHFNAVSNTLNYWCRQGHVWREAQQGTTPWSVDVWRRHRRVWLVIQQGAAW